MGLLDHVTGRRMKTPTGPATGAARTPRFAVIDVETTGLSPAGERIIELAIVRADEHGRPIDQWVSRFHPGRPFGATHVHGITDADVAHAPRFADLAVTIGTALQGMVVVGHNAEFDVSFLQAEFARAGMPMPVFSTYCTLQGSTLYLPQLRRRKLADCCAAVGFAVQQAHWALGDAYAAAGLLEHYLALDARTGYDAPLTATRALRAGAHPPVDREPTAATPAHLIPAADGSLPPPQEPESGLLTADQLKDQPATIPDADLEGFDRDPTLLKVVDRRWYEKNKHIYPMSVWEDFDPAKDYSEGGKKDREGNAFFFSSR